MLDLILQYQRPRTTYHVCRLERALMVRDSKAETQVAPNHLPRLSDEWLQRLPTSCSREWIDDLGNVYQFSNTSLGEGDIASRAALSAHSLKDTSKEIQGVFSLIAQLCVLSADKNGYARDAILKQLLPAAYSLWGSPQFQALLKAHFAVLLWDQRDEERRNTEARTSLAFLCRINYSVEVFSQAAQTMAIFNSVECNSVPLEQRKDSTSAPKITTIGSPPLRTANKLGLFVRNPLWRKHLEKEIIKSSFRKLQGGRRHVHAEIQILAYRERERQSTGQSGTVHNYIGCSKLCCLLCWLLLRVNGSCRVRGTHETMVHQWRVPEIFQTEPYIAAYQPMIRSMLYLMRTLLQKYLDQPYPQP